MLKKLYIPGFVLLFIIAVLGLFFCYQISKQADFQDTKTIKIEKGQPLNTIAQNLEKKNIITSKFYFKTYLWLKGLQSSIQAGTYTISPVNIIDLSQILIAGKVDNQTTIQIIEGWNLNQISSYLQEKKFINTSNDFLQQAKISKYQNQFNFLATNPSDSLEGYIFPDTYTVYKDSNADEIINKTLENFSQKVTPAMLTEIRAQNKTLYQVLIMASIIEMEVPNYEDRQVVSGILWKRLNSNMKLQVDSTLKYKIGKQNRNILTLEELSIDSPYNTYMYQGLPPTPICNPGESAIRAAIYPKESDYWFYLSDKQGNTIFSKTATEHEKNVNIYLRNNN